MEELMNLHFTNEWWQFGLPLILMILDIFTGYYNAWKTKDISSSKMRDGLGKKCAELCYIFVGYLFKLAFGNSAIMLFLIIYVCYMELVSLAENCDKLGVKLPPKLADKLNNNKQK